MTCGDTSIGNALVGFGVRQHARAESLFQACSIDHSDLSPLQIIELRAVRNGLRKAFLQILTLRQFLNGQWVANHSSDVDRGNCVRPSNLLRSLTSISLRRIDIGLRVVARQLMLKTGFGNGALPKCATSPDSHTIDFVAVTDSSFTSPRIRESLAAIHQRTLELIVRGASLQEILGGLCDGIDALDPDVISSVLLADADGQHLLPAAGRRVPDDYRQLMTPLPIGPAMGACGTAAFRKERVISSDIATDPLWSGPAEKYRRMALQHGLQTACSVPIVSDNGTLLGTFGLHHAKTLATVDELELLEKAAHIALIAIERDRAQTALKDALAEVRKSEAELRTIVDVIPQFIVVLAPDGQVLYVNQSTLEYTGLPADLARGFEFRQRVLHPADVERLRTERGHALERGEPFENEQRVRRHDGAYRWFLIRYRPLRGEHGGVVRW